jgi:hypothetical protein
MTGQINTSFFFFHKAKSIIPELHRGNFKLIHLLVLGEKWNYWMVLTNASWIIIVMLGGGVSQPLYCSCNHKAQIMDAG